MISFILLIIELFPVSCIVLMHCMNDLVVFCHVSLRFVRLLRRLLLFLMMLPSSGDAVAAALLLLISSTLLQAICPLNVLIYCWLIWLLCAMLLLCFIKSSCIFSDCIILIIHNSIRTNRSARVIIIDINELWEFHCMPLIMSSRLSLI